MKALIWLGKSTVKVRVTITMDVPKPKVAEVIDVILEVTGSTFCGSDLHLLHDKFIEMEKGNILEHEFCGVVKSMGAGVKGLKTENHIFTSFQIICRDMTPLQKPSQCEKTNCKTPENGMYGGRTAVLFGDVKLLKLPDTVPDENGLYLSDVLAALYNCVIDTKVYKGDVVVFWSAGLIVQMCAEFALKESRMRSNCLNYSGRLESEYPHIETIDFSVFPKGEPVTSQLKKMVDSRGRQTSLSTHYFKLEVYIEIYSFEIVNELIRSVRNFGHFGIAVVHANHFKIGALMERGIHLIGNVQVPVHLYWDKLMKDIMSGDLDALKVDKVYYKFEANADSKQKVFALTKFSMPPRAVARIS
ncbi:chaperonin 10-like protein [Calycina marina]|uniref:Chaperonin 10-like protein n=1 Tax=Calycina marina TaxID=1763456 RepID=A0A9P7Z8L2_9HELO|nr:chaperonin 10-like protein [Calycina marina]